MQSCANYNKRPVSGTESTSCKLERFNGLFEPVSFNIYGKFCCTCPAKKTPFNLFQFLLGTLTFRTLDIDKQSK